MRSLFAELQRRNVIRVAVLYAVTSWVILQVGSFLFTAMDLPAKWTRLIIVVLLLGFPLALIFSWIYELTPEGLRREHEIDRDESITRQTGRRINILIVALLVIAIGGLIVDRVFPRQGGARDATADATPTAAASTPAAPPTATDRSVAVLPFVNMSSDKEQEYFSDGLTEEMINLLAQLPELRVIGRTSSFQFKGKNEDLRDIAHKLGVAHVLEGSVRKSGDRVRITAQLVRALDGSHVWSKTYDRTLDDVFKIQDEIADEIFKTLKVTLMGHETPRAGASTNLAAYDLYLKGRAYAEPRTREGLQKALATYQDAIKIDPNYALAWVGLASAYSDGASYSDLYTPHEGARLAHDAIDHALKLQPDLAEAHIMLGSILYNDWDWDGASRAFERANELAPGNADLIRQRAYLAATVGRFEDAITLLQESLRLDPLRVATVNGLSVTLRQLGRFAEAEAIARQVIDEHPDFDSGYQTLALCKLLQGDLAQARENIAREPSPIWKPLGEAIIFHALGDRAASDVALNALIEHFADGSAYQVAEIYAFRGESDKAFEWLDRAYVQGDSGLSEIVGDVLMRNVEHDPRYVAMLKKLRLPTDIPIAH